MEMYPGIYPGIIYMTRFSTLVLQRVCPVTLVSLPEYDQHSKQVFVPGGYPRVYA